MEVKFITEAKDFSVFFDGLYKFSGSVYINNKDFKLIKSSQYVKSFPFTPKTFFIDVIKIKISMDEIKDKKLNYSTDNNKEYYYTMVKDIKQLDKVFEYYDMSI